MSSALLSVVLIFAFQVNAALVPQKRPKPDLPKIDENACPFEGCQFGKWTVREPVQLYADWKEDRRPLRLLHPGTVVEAVTGIHVTFKPAEIQVTAPMPQFGLKPGDTVFAYMNLGEGFFNAWFNGSWVENFDGSGVSGMGCERDCNARLMKDGRSEWWVKVKTKEGTIAWTNQAENFDGTDALAVVNFGESIPIPLRRPNP